MRYALFTTVSLTICTVLLASGCKKEDETPPPNTGAYPQQQGYGQPGGYQQQQPGAYPQQQQPGAYPQQQQPGAYPQQQQPGAYPQQQQPGAYPQQQPGAAQPGAAAPGASPPPNAIATACRSDADCIGAKCNLQAQKCQFPCGSNNDCQTGWACTLGACAPNLNTQPR
jgi:hypothetical protein